MDGSPVKGEVIPVRFFLGGNPGLTPTYRNVYNKFSVKYFINLVIVDENGRRFFKQQEIVLWRKAPLRVLRSSAEAHPTSPVPIEEEPQVKEFSLPTPRATPHISHSAEPEKDSNNNDGTQENTQTKEKKEEEEKEEVKKEEN